MAENVRKQYRKELTFQAGEISPRFYGRSDTVVYDKGLAEALNVVVDMRGGVFKRGGTKHLYSFSGNDARLFTLQASLQRYYTILITDSLMRIIAPGANLLDGNVVSNPDFREGATGWTTVVEPVESQVRFSVGEVDLDPVNVDRLLTTNGDFTFGETGWTVYTSAGGDVTFDLGVCSLAPNPDAASSYAGVGQQITGATIGVTQEIRIDAEFFSGQVEVRIGDSLGDGAHLIQTLSANTTITFDAPVTDYWVTVVALQANATLINLDVVDVYEHIIKTAAITQQLTIVNTLVAHTVSVSQLTKERLHIDIGTTPGGNDVGTWSFNERAFFATFTPGADTIYLTVRADGDETDLARVNHVLLGESVTGTADVLEMPAPWTEDQLSEIHIIESPNASSLYFTHPNVPVQVLQYDRGSDTFVPLQDVNFTSPPTQWGGTNWPATGTHFQGRLWLGGTPNEPETFWGSYSGIDTDFSFTTTDPGGDEIVTDANAIELTIQKFGHIRWMNGTKQLMIGTVEGEYAVLSNGPVITPSDFSVRQQSSFGSNYVQSLQVGERLIYVTPDGRKVRSMYFLDNIDNWVSQDLTFSSDHITDGVVGSMVWMQHPLNLLLMGMEDGRLIGLTYDRQSDTLGWTQHQIENAEVLSVATGKRRGINEMVVAIVRESGRIDIEVLIAHHPKLDSFAERFSSTPVNDLTGLDHLEGEIVTPVVDGAVNPPVQVVGGAITTQQAGNHIAAGLSYTARIKTLPPDVPESQIRSWKKHWNKIWVLMLSSKAPLVNGKRPPDRSPATPMDTVEPDHSGHFKVINLGWDDAGQITIEQDLPVDMAVLAIYGEMKTGSLT